MPWRLATQTDDRGLPDAPAARRSPERSVSCRRPTGSPRDWPRGARDYPPAARGAQDRFGRLVEFVRNRTGSSFSRRRSTAPTARNGLIAVVDHTGDVQKHTRQHAASQACLHAPYPVKCSPGLSSGYGGMAAPQAFHASWHAFLSFHQNSNSFFLVTEGCHQV